MLKRFPGRTLEELDGIDWPRLMRAVMVEKITEAEEKRRLFFQGSIKDMSEAEWKIIQENETLLQKWSSDHER